MSKNLPQQQANQLTAVDAVINSVWSLLRETDSRIATAQVNQNVDLSRQFKFTNEIPFDMRIGDGFSVNFWRDTDENNDSKQQLIRESLLIDESNGVLLAFTKTVNEHISRSVSSALSSAATAVATLVIDRMGGIITPELELKFKQLLGKHFPNNHHTTDAATTVSAASDTTTPQPTMNDNHLITNPTSTAAVTVIPLSLLVANGIGMVRHRVILFKYIADRLSDHQQQLRNIPCRVTRSFPPSFVSGDSGGASLSSAADKVIMCSTVDTGGGENFHIVFDRITVGLFKEGSTDATVHTLPSITHDNRSTAMSVIAKDSSSSASSSAPVATTTCAATSATSSSSSSSSAAVPLLTKSPFILEKITAARESWLSSLGTVNPCLIVSRRIDAPSFYVVHRMNGNVIFISCGLWDPTFISNTSEGTPTTTTTTTAEEDIELIGEAHESELGGDLSNCWLFQCLLEVACTAKRNYARLRKLLRERKYATMEVLNVHVLPPAFTDPFTGRACMLLGIDSAENMPKQFATPYASVQLVTARLLTLSQWRDSQEFAVGKRPLALRFQRDTTHHVSSLLTVQRIPNHNTDIKIGDGAMVVGTCGATTDKNKPDMNWTVQRFVDRVTVAVRLDATTKVKKDATMRLTVPFLNETVASTAAANLAMTKRDTYRATIGSAVITLTVASVAAGGAEKDAGVAEKAAGGAEKAARGAEKAAAGAEKAAGGAEKKSSNHFLAQLAASVEPFQTLSPIADWDPPISSGVFVDAFDMNSEIAGALRPIAYEIRRILAPNSTTSEFTRSAAQTVYGAIGTQSQLYGWQHVSEFIRNPALYLERTASLSTPRITNNNNNNSSTTTSAAASAAAGIDPSTWPARGPAELHEAIDLLQEIGHSIVKRLIQRITWIMAVFQRDKVQWNAAFVLEVLVTDARWVEDATMFMKQCEERLAELLAKNPQRFNSFRELQKKGVQWPHAPELRKEVEKQGFTFRPMMIKRDRCVCDTCGAEITGFRPWFEPRAYHDYSKHTAAFHAQMYPPNLITL